MGQLRLLVCPKKGDRLYLCTGMCGTNNCEKGIVKLVEFDEYWNAINYLEARGEGRIEDYYKVKD